MTAALDLCELCIAQQSNEWTRYNAKTKRIKQKASQFRTEMDAMEKDERKAYIRALVKNNPDFLDSQTTNPFTTEDVIEVRYFTELHSL